MNVHLNRILIGALTLGPWFIGFAFFADVAFTVAIVLGLAFFTYLFGWVLLDILQTWKDD